MMVNAVVDATTIIGVSYALSRVLRGGWALAAMISSTLVAAIPISGDSILMGTQTQFYFLMALSLASLWFLADVRSGVGGGGSSGSSCAVASYFAMASGALTFAAAACLESGADGVRPKRGPGRMAGGLALAGAAVLAVGLVPQCPGDRADSGRIRLSNSARL